MFTLTAKLNKKVFVTVIFTSMYEDFNFLSWRNKEGLKLFRRFRSDYYNLL